VPEARRRLGAAGQHLEGRAHLGADGPGHVVEALLVGHADARDEIEPLLAGGGREGRKAAFAAATARSTSAAAPMAITPTGASVAGLMTSRRAAEEGSTHWPPM
jgi:hypothetical protein